MNAIQLEKVSLSDMQNRRTVFNPLTAYDKYSLLKKVNLLQHFEMQLSQTQKIFSQFFFPFSKFRFNFQLFQKNVTLIADVFLN